MGNTQASGRGAWRLAGLVVLGAGLFALGGSVDWTGWLDEERLREILEAFGAFAPLGFVLLMATAVVVAPIPSLPLDVAGGAAFGWLWGGLLAVAGATLGAAVSFGIARGLGREFVARWIGGHVLLCSQCSDRVLTGMVLISRLIPAVSFDLVSYGAGLTRMSFSRFVVATAIGMTPLTFLYTALGPTLLSEGPALWVWGAVAVLTLVGLPRLLEHRGWIRPESWPHREGR